MNKIAVLKRFEARTARNSDDKIFLRVKNMVRNFSAFLVVVVFSHAFTLNASALRELISEYDNVCKSVALVPQEAHREFSQLATEEEEASFDIENQAPSSCTLKNSMRAIGRSFLSLHVKAPIMR